MRPTPTPLTISVPEAGKRLGLGRDASYAAASRGEIPTIQFGRRLVVPLPLLLQLVGASAASDVETEGLA